MNECKQTRAPNNWMLQLTAHVEKKNDYSKIKEKKNGG